MPKLRNGHEITWATDAKIFAQHLNWLTPLPYMPVGNAEDGQKDKSVAQVIKYTFLRYRWNSKLSSALSLCMRHICQTI
ncbi:MAG: hypothetical protein CVV13_13630 [Gammaproteobacteria bacterium HGW-Gammaproteobacteria-3]|nr:MAG: hypothetical protein CVV13_13630 [Gammaproteobacteria bacterium HGW-Gammaproteobacteria-3]